VKKKNFSVDVWIKKYTYLRQFESRRGEAYLIKPFLIKFVSDLQFDWFSVGISVFSINENDRRDITEILLKHHNPNPKMLT